MQRQPGLCPDIVTEATAVCRVVKMVFVEQFYRKPLE